MSLSDAFFPNNYNLFCNSITTNIQPPGPSPIEPELGVRTVINTNIEPYVLLPRTMIKGVFDFQDGTDSTDQQVVPPSAASIFAALLSVNITPKVGTMFEFVLSNNTTSLSPSALRVQSAAPDVEVAGEVSLGAPQPVAIANSSFVKGFILDPTGVATPSIILYMTRAYF
jgi:hypothetical protein